MQKHLSESPKAKYMRGYYRRPKGAIYLCWRHMVGRCCNPADKSFHRYGGKGITVCEDWKSYPAFYKWAVVGWKFDLQIDRIDNSKGYYPGNCHWVTSRQNNRNRCNNKLDVAKVAEIRRLLSEGSKGPALARKFDVHHSLIYRIKLGQQWL